MTFKTRRIVTSHDANGKGVVKTDELLTATSRGGQSDIVGCELWSTDAMPVDNSEESDAAQRQGLVTRYNYVGTGQGTVFRILEMAPGAATLEHRTETVDYGIVLSGEGELHLDGGEVIHMKPGDVIVNRGAMHKWVNNGSVPFVAATALIDASPVTVAGQELGVEFRGHSTFTDEHPH